MRVTAVIRQPSTVFASIQEDPVNVRIRNTQIVQNATDYATLVNKPSINEHELAAGENSLESIGIGLASIFAIDSLFH